MDKGSGENIYLKQIGNSGNLHVCMYVCMYVGIQQISPCGLHDLGDFCLSFHIPTFPSCSWQRYNLCVMDRVEREKPPDFYYKFAKS